LIGKKFLPEMEMMSIKAVMLDRKE
jgi:hypothetical protein